MIAGPGAPLISLKAISKRFSSGTLALEDLSLDLAQGEFLSLLGPSGCGKSTLLRIIAGLAKPSSGTIDWSAPESAASGKEQSIGFVFQDPTLMPWATAFDNVFLPLRLQGQDRNASRQAVGEALAMVGLEEFSGAYPHELSGGMKMRVSIARALVTRPRLLLLDEPFAALDEITRFKLNDDLLRLWRSFGWTVVFVTHSVFESVFLAQRIAVMAARPGRLAAEIEVKSPYPRDEIFRTSEEYNRFCRTTSAALHGAILESNAP